MFKKITQNLDHFCQTAIAWLFSLLIMFLPFVFCWLNDELFEFNKMLFTYAFTILIVGLWVMRMIKQKQILWRKTFLDWPLGLFLLSQLISTIFSLHPRTSWLGYYTRLNGGLFSTLAYILLYYAFINNLNRSQKHNFIFATFFSGIFISLYAIFEHFGHSFSCLIIKGRFDVSCWVQDVQTRVFATFGQPNWLATYNVALIGLGTPLLMQTFTHNRKKSLSLLSSPLMTTVVTASVYLNFLALIFTKSRSGTLAFFASLSLTLILFFFSWWRTKTFSKKQWQALALVLLGFFIPALIWGTQYTPSFKDFMAKASAQSLQPLSEQIPAHLQHLDLKITDSADIRKIVWQGALAIWRAYPLFGTGVETFAYSYYNFRPTDHNWTSEWDFLYNKAHNELLNFAANSGTFGLFTYLSLFIVFAYKVWFYFWTKKDSALLIGLSSGLLAISVTNFFGFSTVTSQVLLFLFFALANEVLSQKTSAIEAQKIEENKNFTWQQKTGFGLTILLILFLLTKVWTYWSADYYYSLCKTLATKSDVNLALQNCQQAINLSQVKEPLYLADTADFYAQYALALAEQDPQSPYINLLANESLRLSNLALQANSVQLNLYKTRFRTLMILAQLDPQALSLVQTSLDTALSLAPTDPKLAYYYAIFQKRLGHQADYRWWLQKALELRPQYTEARLELAKAEKEAGNYQLATQHYQWLVDNWEKENLTASQELTNLATFSGIIAPR